MLHPTPPPSPAAAPPPDAQRKGIHRRSDDAGRLQRQHEQQMQREQQQQQFTADLAALARSILLLDLCPQLLAVRLPAQCRAQKPGASALSVPNTSSPMPFACLRPLSALMVADSCISIATGGPNSTTGPSVADASRAARAAARAAVAAAGRRRHRRLLQRRPAQEARRHAGVHPASSL